MDGVEPVTVLERSGFDQDFLSRCPGLHELLRSAALCAGLSSGLDGALQFCEDEPGLLDAGRKGDPWPDH